MNYNFFFEKKGLEKKNEKKMFFLSFHVGAAKKCRQPVGQKLKEVGREREKKKEEGGRERIEGKETERGDMV